MTWRNPRPDQFVGARSYGQDVNRTDRLYALVEELRACAPRRRSARELASLYEVSARTVERDIGALQQAGVPVYADTGRSGGYTVDKSLTLPPLNFSPAEAVALAVALARVNVGPFEGAARSAVRKIVAAMSEPDVTAARDLAGRVRLLEPVAAPQTVPVPSVIEQAIVARRVLWICYRDRDGNEWDVEPGSSTDLGSTPSLVDWIVSRTHGAPAYVLHDRFYRHWIKLGQATYAQADRILRQALGEQSQNTGHTFGADDRTVSVEFQLA